MRLLSLLEKSKNFWFVVFTSIIYFMLRFPSMFEPYWYGDEGIYQSVGLGLRKGGMLYKDFFDNKPPLLYIFYAFFDSDQFMIRLLSLIFGLLSVIAFFYLSRLLFKKRLSYFISTLLFAIIFGLPIIEGNIANAENFMLLFNILAGILVFKSISENNFNKKLLVLFIAGFAVGISFLFKIVGLFDFSAFLLFLSFILFHKETKISIKKIAPIALYIIGFIIPIFITIIYFVSNNAFSYFLKATFLNNIDYVGLENDFILPQGLLILKTIILVTSIFILFLRRKNFDLVRAFIYLWLFFSVYSAFFSQRPYIHYLLLVLPAFSLLIGLALLKEKLLKLDIVVGVVIFLILITNFNYYKKTTSYYLNFISFMTYQKSVYDYENFFDRNTPRDYEVASFINNYGNEDSKIFVWGNNAQIYKLTNKLSLGRYAVEYHIVGYEDGLDNTKENLIKKSPEYIIIMPNVSKYPFSLKNYKLRINLKGVSIYEKNS